MLIFFKKRKRILELIRRHYLKTYEEFQTSTRWANWKLRDKKLHGLADKLKIGKSKLDNLYKNIEEESNIERLKRIASNYEQQ